MTLLTALVVLASFGVATPAAPAAPAAPATVGETNTVTHCKSYGYVCTSRPGSSRSAG